MSFGHFAVENGLVSLGSSRISRANLSPMPSVQEYAKSDWDTIETVFNSDFDIHDRLLRSDNFETRDAILIYYMRASTLDRLSNYNSSYSNWHIEARSTYENAQKRLSELKGAVDDDGDPIIEEGAVDSAIEVLGHLSKRNMAPPSVSWHGGDAVVMLWALGDITWAVTITDGEVGYVVRKNRQTASTAHSLPLHSFRLEDLR